VVSKEQMRGKLGDSYKWKNSVGKREVLFLRFASLYLAAEEPRQIDKYLNT